MESLLCEEDWLRSPLPLTPQHHYPTTCHKERNLDNTTITMEDDENALMVFFHKEVIYMPQPRLQSLDSLHARIRAVQWFIKTCCRLNLSFDTVFNATNYLDRFISINQSNVRSVGLIELVSVACLSISAKFGEVYIPQLHELQMDDLDHSFQPIMIQQMELTVLKALEWRLVCVTSYSYMELLLNHLDSLQPHFRSTLTSRLTELLLGALTDPKFIEFRPSIIAVSALQCGLEELLPSKFGAYLSDVLNLIPQNQMDDIENCHKIMEERVADPLHSLSVRGYSYFPSSPVTVMPMQRIDTFNCYIDLSLSMVSASNSNFPSNPKKRKRGEDC